MLDAGRMKASWKALLRWDGYLLSTIDGVFLIYGYGQVLRCNFYSKFRWPKLMTTFAPAYDGNNDDGIYNDFIKFNSISCNRVI